MIVLFFFLIFKFTSFLLLNFLLRTLVCFLLPLFFKGWNKERSTYFHFIEHLSCSFGEMFQDGIWVLSFFFSVHCFYFYFVVFFFLWAFRCMWALKSFSNNILQNFPWINWMNELLRSHSEFIKIKGFFYIIPECGQYGVNCLMKYSHDNSQTFLYIVTRLT